MDIGLVSLIVSGFVASVTALNFLNTMSVRKEAGLDKFAKAAAVDNELIVIRKDIADVYAKLEDHGQKISNLQVGHAVLNSQVGAQLREVEKLGDKLDEWRKNE
jgi:predicted nuclease with TOPRIM domain